MHDTAWTGEYYFFDHAIHNLSKKDRFGTLQEVHWLRVPELSPSRFAHGLRKSRHPAFLSQYQEIGAPEHCVRRAGPLQDGGKKDLFPNQLSGGQQQLVGIARAIIASPKLILADEPTGNLHSNQGKEIMELFKKLNDEGTTIVQVTHNEKNAEYGNRVIYIEDGWI